MEDYRRSKFVLDLRERRPGLQEVYCADVPVSPKRSYKTFLAVCLTLIMTIGVSGYAGQGNDRDANSISNISVEAATQTDSEIIAESVVILNEKREASLQEILEEAVLAEPGKISVMVETFDGGDYSAGVTLGDEFNPYSTYKLFIAWLVLEKVDKGLWKFTDSVFEDHDVEACLRDMIVVSDNKCPETFFGMLGGRAAIEKVIRTRGYDNTYFVGTLSSTVGDQIIFLRQLYQGELLESSTTGYLINLMKNQKFREGIAAGVDAPVANKVGFQSDYLHDSAIVYGSKITYGISIYTKGSSWQSIAEIARKVHAFMEK